MLPKEFILAQIMFLARYRDYGEYITNLPLPSSQTLFLHGGSKKTCIDFCHLKKLLRYCTSEFWNGKTKFLITLCSCYASLFICTITLLKLLMRHVDFFCLVENQIVSEIVSLENISLSHSVNQCFSVHLLYHILPRVSEMLSLSHNSALRFL